MWEWTEEDENFRDQDRNIKNQPRYKLGLENANDSYPNEGWIWREKNNEPFLWSHGKDENPYPHSDILWKS